MLQEAQTLKYLRENLLTCHLLGGTQTHVDILSQGVWMKARSLAQKVWVLNQHTWPGYDSPGMTPYKDYATLAKRMGFPYQIYTLD